MDHAEETITPPADKSKLIRTFAKDVAALGQEVPKEFTPAPAEKKKPIPVAKKKIVKEKKKPIHEVLPPTPPPQKEDPSFVPVAPQKAKEFKPSPMPFSVPLPAPMPKAVQPEKPVAMPPPPVAPSPIHTYKTDFADTIDTKKASTFSVLAEQLDAGNAPAPKTLVKEKTAFPVLPVALAVLLLLAGGGGVWFAYTTTLAPTPNIPVLSVPTLVFADDRKELSGADFTTSLENALGDSLDEGKIRVLYSATASSTAGGILHIPDAGNVLISQLHLEAPDLLLRNIAPISTTGMIRQNGVVSAFFVLRVSSYERTFSAMLSWESQMAQALAWLYKAPEAVTPSDTIATSSPKVATTTLVTSIVRPPTFKDVVVGNYNMRVLTASDGSIILCYGYKDKQTLIIAKNPDVFVTLSGRLVDSK